MPGGGEKPRALARNIAEPVRQLPRRARVQAATVVRKQVPARAREAFRVDLASQLLAGIYLGSVFPFVNIIARGQLHATPEVLALMTAAPFIGNLFALFWARAMEGRRKVPYVKWSHVTARATVLFMAFARTPWSFAALISGAQIAGTVATPAYAAVIKDVYPDAQRGRIMSLTRAALLSAQIVATFVAGWVLTRYPYEILFPFAAVVGIAAAFVFGRINPREGEDLEDEEAVADDAEQKALLRPLQAVRETAVYLVGVFDILRTDTAFRWFAFSVFTYGFGNLLMMPIIPIIQVDDLGMTTAEMAWLANISQIVAVGAYFYWGRFIDLNSPQRAVVISILLNALVPFFYMGANSFVWLMPAFVIQGVTNAGIDLSYFNAILGFADDRTVSRYQALQSFLLGIRGSLAPFAGGALAGILKAHQVNLRYSFIVALVFIVTGCWMQIVAMRRAEGKLG